MDNDTNSPPNTNDRHKLSLQPKNISSLACCCRHFFVLKPNIVANLKMTLEILLAFNLQQTNHFALPKNIGNDTQRLPTIYGWKEENPTFWVSRTDVNTTNNRNKTKNWFHCLSYYVAKNLLVFEGEENEIKRRNMIRFVCFGK